MITKINKGFKFRIYPTSKQKEFFIQMFGACRWVWNRMLADKISYYEENHKQLNNTPAQYKNDNPWLKKLDSYAFCNEQMNLQKAFNNFFRAPGKIGFPKFKSKKNEKNSYKTNYISEITNNYIKLPKIGKVKIILHRQLPDDSRIVSATISCNSCEEYYVSLCIEYGLNIPEIQLDKSKALGLDFSLPSFYVDSQGIACDYPKFYRNAQDKLAKEQRKLSKMQKDSNNYIQQKLKVAKIHNHLKNQRNDWLNCKSKELASQYDYIIVEDINLQGLAQCLNFGKTINDESFGKFRDMLNYKLFETGKLGLIKIDKWFPSSKTCHHCGSVNKLLTLYDRTWICPDCGSIIERDFNAALNIRDLGLSQI